MPNHVPTMIALALLHVALTLGAITPLWPYNPCGRKSDYGEGDLYWVAVKIHGSNKSLAAFMSMTSTLQKGLGFRALNRV